MVGKLNKTDSVRVLSDRDIFLHIYELSAVLAQRARLYFALELHQKMSESESDVVAPSSLDETQHRSHR